MDNPQTLTEFEVIRRFFEGIGPAKKSSVIPLGMGDDCALLDVPDGYQLAMSIDTLVAGRHFPIEAAADDIAHRSLAVSVSDLAAMGARPVAFTLAISLPSIEVDWLNAFRRGLSIAADFYDIPLVGGDTTQGPLTITIQVHGVVGKYKALKRSAANVGDRIYVSGNLGDASAALAMLNQSLSVDEAQRHYLLSRFYQPTARIQLGEALQGIATSAIDVSDGLLADLKHIADASQVSATVDVDALPVSDVLIALLEKKQALEHALTGGDDYELCFTAPANQQDTLMELGRRLDTPIHHIGHISKGTGIVCVNDHGLTKGLSRSGYQHFS